MFIYYAEIYRCKRIGLKGSDRMVVRPTQKTQMVLGTNGSGKSSLLKYVMTVIPPDKQHFHVGGHKIIKVRDDNHKYRLETHYEKSSPKHKFIKDGIELNQGGTGAVQRELIKQHFGITEEINDVLTGVAEFTKMSAMERRDWITRLSTTDFSYVLDFYNRIRRSSRDQDALIRNARKRLSEEKPKLLDDDQEIALLKRSSDLNDELNELIGSSHRLTMDNQTIAVQLRQESVELERRIGVFLKTPIMSKVDGYKIHSIEDLRHHIDTVKGKLSHHESVMSVLDEQFHTVEHKLEQIKTISGMDEQFVRNELASATREIDNLYGMLRTGLDPFSLKDINRHNLIKVDDIRTSLMNITSTISERFTDTAHREAQGQLNQLIEEHHRLHGNISQVEGRLDHIHSCAEVTCPKCSHDFKPGVKEGEVQILVDGLNEDRKRLDLVLSKMNELRGFVGEAQVYRGKISELEQLRMTERSLAPLWSFIDDQGGFARGGSLTIPLMNFVEDVKVSWRIAELKSKIDLYNESLDRYREASANNSMVNDQYFEAKKKIEENTQRVLFFQDELGKLESALQNNQTLDRMYQALRNDVNRINQLKESLVESIRQEHISEAVEQTRNSLISVNKILSTQQAQSYLVKDISGEHSRAIKEHALLKKIEEALSPKDGIIAEQICMFINVVISRINEVIARVWGFNLALMPLDLEAKPMDYKFPLYNGTKDNESDDVSKGSSSMQEIVDQAFRLVVYKMMGLKNFPLYIDELGKGFDPIHRANLVFAIKDMIDDPMYSQVFIISHYEDSMNSYPNSEIIVTDDSHVTPTREYNQHVVFE